MYQSSQKFEEKLNETSRRFKARITIGSDFLSEEIKTMVFTQGSCGSDTFTIGSVFASYVDITTSATDVVFSGKEFYIEIGLQLSDNNVEYIPMGYYTAAAADITKTRDSMTLKAADRISSACGGAYIPTVSFPATIKAVLSDIEQQAGITIETSLDTSGTIETEMSGLLYREALGYIAGLLGGFCYADRSGKIQIAAFPATQSVKVEAERFADLQPAENTYSIDSLTVSVSEGGEDADGNTVEGVSYTEGSGTGITVANPYMTESLFDSMKGRVVGYSFRPGTAQFLGDPRLGPEDAITAVDYAGKEYFMPCMSLIQDYDGGLTTTVATPGQASSDEAVKGPITQQIERLSTDMLLTKEVVAKKITADEADLKYASIDKLDAVEGNVETLKGDFASFRSGEFEELRSDYAVFQETTTENLSATNAKIEAVSGDLADYRTVVAGELEAQNAKISAIESSQITTEYLETNYARADLANIKDGSITTAMIETGAIGTAQIADGSITDAKIVGLTASKITAGKIDASEIEVVNLNAANITVGTINGQQIAQGAIDIDNLSGELSETIVQTQEDVEKAVQDAMTANQSVETLSSDYASYKTENDASVQETKESIENLNIGYANVQKMISGLTDGTLLYNVQCIDNGDETTTLKAVVYKAGEDVTQSFPAKWFTWYERSEDGREFIGQGRSITVKNDDSAFGGTSYIGVFETQDVTILIAKKGNPIITKKKKYIYKERVAA